MSRPFMNDIGPGLRAKSASLKAQFLNLEVTEPRLIGIVCAGGVWVAHRNYPTLVITSVARPEGAHTSPHTTYKERPRTLAIDLRAHYARYTTEQEEELLKFWRTYFPRFDMLYHESRIDAWRGIARIHGEGANRHIHVAIPPLNRALEAIKWKKP
jgi:hypothetical protein